MHLPSSHLLLPSLSSLSVSLCLSLSLSLLLSPSHPEVGNGERQQAKGDAAASRREALHNMLGLAVHGHNERPGADVVTEHQDSAGQV